MSFDGLTQNIPAVSSGSQFAIYQAEKNRKKSAIPPVMDNPDWIDEVHKENAQHPPDDEGKHKHRLTQEEQEQILAFAKLRGIVNLSFEEGIVYRFQVNEATGMIELIEDSSKKVMFEFSPEELSDVFSRLARYAGHVADQCA